MTPRARYRNGPPPTIEEYRALDRQGRIRRPLTDPQIGADPTRRQHDAIASDAVTEVLGVTPGVVADPAAPTKGRGVMGWFMIGLNVGIWLCVGLEQLTHRWLDKHYPEGNRCRHCRGDDPLERADRQ